MNTMSVETMELNNEKTKHSRIPFYIGVILFLASICVRNIWDIEIPIIIVLGIASLTALFSDRDEIIALVVCCIPASAAFQYKYFIIVCIVVWLLKYGKDIKFAQAALPLLLMMVWELLHAFFYPFSIEEFLRGFAEIIMCTLLMISTPRKVNYKLICRVLAIASICMMVIVLFNVLEKTDYDFEAVFAGSYRFGVGDEDAEQYGVNYNANTLGLIALISISGLFQLIAAKKQSMFDYIMIIVLILFGVMTMSRAFLLCFAVLILLFAVSGAPTVSAKIKRVLLIAISVILILLLVTSIMPNIYERFAERFEEDDITGGRADVFTLYTEHILSSPSNLLFGLGMQDYLSIASRMNSSITLGCHNGTQELIVCWGLPGLAMFIWFVVELVRRKPDGLKRSISNYIPLIVVLIFVQSIQLITQGQALLIFTFAYAGLSADLEPCKNDKIAEDIYGNR